VPIVSSHPSAGSSGHHRGLTPDTQLVRISQPWSLPAEGLCIITTISTEVIEVESPEEVSERLELVQLLIG